VHSTLQNNTFSQLFVGQNIITLDSVDSTNSWLKNLLSNSEPLPEGTVILAEHQFAGRGQTNHSWVSEAGKNLTFSILLKPGFLSPDKQFDLNKAVSLAINDVLFKYFPHQATIKWPNDSYVDNEKIGGLLIENIIQGEKLKYAVIGIGMNINQVNFPDAVKNVTSFHKILHKDYDLKILLTEICSAVEARYLQLSAGKIEKLNSEYLNRLYRYNEISQFTVNGIVQNGKICGISPEGYLKVQIEDEVRQFGLKEIQFVIET
jgi:BirA family transcriptional regulator, biotin operon repressor / biotin---[acetyl-CoA-carboxylase] ligase